MGIYGITKTAVLCRMLNEKFFTDTLRGEGVRKREKLMQDKQNGRLPRQMPMPYSRAEKKGVIPQWHANQQAIKKTEDQKNGK